MDTRKTKKYVIEQMTNNVNDLLSNIVLLEALDNHSQCDYRGDLYDQLTTINTLHDRTAAALNRARAVNGEQNEKRKSVLCEIE